MKNTKENKEQPLMNDDETKVLFKCMGVFTSKLLVFDHRLSRHSTVAFCKGVQKEKNRARV